MKLARIFTTGTFAVIACMLVLIFFVPREQPQRQPAGTRYTCCHGLADEQTVLAGETLVLPWTVVAHQPGAKPNPADLNVTLIGPFGSLADAKHFAPSGPDRPTVVESLRVTVEARTVRASGDPDQQLESVLVVPNEPGYYTLVPSTTYENVTVSGGLVLRVNVPFNMDS